MKDRFAPVLSYQIHLVVAHNLRQFSAVRQRRVQVVAARIQNQLRPGREDITPLRNYRVSMNVYVEDIGRRGCVEMFRIRIAVVRPVLVTPERPGIEEDRSQ